MKRIVVTGAESTGKTTLTQALSGYYGEPWSAEFVRTYVDKLDRELEIQDLETIARGQLTHEDLGLEKVRHFMFHDTNLLSSIIYANYYFNTVIDWVNTRFLERDYSLYLLCLPDIPWVAEPGQRESPIARNALHRRFKESLVRLQLPHVEISGNKTERLGLAVSAIEDLARK